MAAFVVLRAFPLVMWKGRPFHITKGKGLSCSLYFFTPSYHSFGGEYFILLLIFFIIFGLGTAGDALTNHNGYQFSTKDQDNDGSKCAEINKGAWWFHNCRDSSLNGVYYHGQSDKQFYSAYCIYWGKICPAKRAQMKIRLVSF